MLVASALACPPSWPRCQSELIFARGIHGAEKMNGLDLVTEPDDPETARRREPRKENARQCEADERCSQGET
jgi:hypothetical protein